jgi:hypothetical protein
MQHAARFLPIGLASLFVVARPALALTVFEDKATDRILNVGILLQPQVAFREDGAPSGHDLSTDFFLRRVRMYTGGQIAKGLTFFLQVDQPNLDLNGDFAAQLSFRDAWMSYEFAREINLDAGLILWPFTHNSLEGAGSLHTIDYRNPGLLYPTTEGKGFSDTGVQLRGLLLDDRLHYRVGAFEGARNNPAANMPGATPINEKAIPRFMGMLRWNFLGVEDKFFLNGVYFADHPMLSVGVGADFQPNALRLGTTGVTDYSAFNADVFLEYPMPGDNAVIANLAVAKWNEGTGSPTTAVTVFGELGYRMGIIEPVLAVDYLKASDDVREFYDIRPEINFWFRKHNGNLKAEAAFSSDKRPPAFANRQFVVTVQGQVYF